MFLDRGVEGALRVAVLLGLTLAALPVLRRAPASARRLLLSLALGGALLLPAVSAIVPALRVTAPSAIVVSRGPFLEPLAPDGPVLATAGASAAPALVAAPVRSVDLRAVAVAVWLLGAAVVLARLGLGVMRARAMVRRAEAAPSWSGAIARAARVMGIHADVRASDEVDAPAVTGVISPVVLVPRASETWTEERRYMVLLHELSHVRQRDCLAQIVAQVACAVHWFDPLVWIAARRLRIERELSADDAVLAAGTKASFYAEDLLAIAGAAATAREVPAGALGMAERSELAARVTAIVARGARRTLSRGRTALLVAGCGTTLFVVACATPEVKSPEDASHPAAASTPAPSAAASTIDAKLQAIADEELDRTLAEWQGRAGTIVVLDPATGAVLANAGREKGARVDVAVTHAYMTGSTLKPITLAAALDEGVITPADRFDCENGARKYDHLVLRDAGSYGTLTVPEMLAVSTNIGFAKIFDRLGADRMDRWLRRFHFGAAPAIEGAVAGEMPPRYADRSFEGAVVAIGEGMAASPLQLAAAYAAIANDGVYVAPTLTRRSGAPPREPLMKPETARTVIAMLEGAVNGERATGKAARIHGARVAGKTGTAEWLARDKDGTYASFVGMFPAERPRFVILVGVEQPREGGTGGTVAAPAFARVATRVLGG
ncbi:Cell division protein FtsI [Minicystis rosea]|nr:Cell division protein FtsI [Minicystis rosea]